MNKKPVKIEVKPGLKIKLNGKVVIPSFKYKKHGEKKRTTYPEKEIAIPDDPGKIVRIYLEKNGSITIKDAPEHELILGEMKIPDIEFEEIGKSGEKIIKKKKRDLNKIVLSEFEIPERS